METETGAKFHIGSVVKTRADEKTEAEARERPGDLRGGVR